ncbi:hypothetical protein ACP4OV_017704 [Aristida adscensionis]
MATAVRRRRVIHVPCRIGEGWESRLTVSASEDGGGEPAIRSAFPPSVDAVDLLPFALPFQHGLAKLAVQRHTVQERAHLEVLGAFTTRNTKTEN